MRKNKIFIKLFTMTVSVVLIILVLQFAFQYLKLEKYYIYNKKKTVTSTLNSLKSKIEKDTLNEEMIEPSLKDISMENDIFLAIFDQYGVPQFGLNQETTIPYIKIRSDDNEVYTIYLDGFVYNQEFLNNIDKNKNIEVEGFLYDFEQKKVSPNTISIDGKIYSYKSDTYNLEDETSIRLDRDNIVIANDINPSNFNILTPIESENIHLKGVSIDVNLVDEKSFSMEYKKDQLLQEAFWFLSQPENLNTIFNNDKIIQYSKEDTYTGMKNLVFVQPVLFKNEGPMFIFALSSLQPIKETTEIMQSYFLFILIAAVFLAIIASYFYSKKITTPLLHLNDVTKTMSNLDFSKKCEVYSNDEIGYLSENINKMSEKLQKTLDEVKKSNEKLKEDILYRKKMDQFRKRFIADASHELKTPLTVIKGICEGIRDGVYDSNDSENFKNILTEVNDMSKLVYDLLESSKLESLEVQSETTIFQLSDIILKTHSKLKHLIENKNLKISLNLSDDFVLADENKIEKVIGNLYYNAVEYTPKNGRINVKMDCNEDTCYFIIENSPANIPKDDLPKIWEPFYRVEKSRNKTLGGSGLGLYMARIIFENHNSEYGIENTSDGVKSYFSLKRIENNG